MNREVSDARMPGMSREIERVWEYEKCCVMVAKINGFK